MVKAILWAFGATSLGIRGYHPVISDYTLVIRSYSLSVRGYPLVISGYPPNNRGYLLDVWSWILLARLSS